MTNSEVSAFPVSTYSKMDGSYLHSTDGLSKREYFAAMAMQGLATQYSEYRDEDAPSSVVRFAVKIADSLILELNKEKK